MTKKKPIGIFDSGIGGLTIAHALVKQLPNENMIYFGDTAHLPYGEKSPAAIQAYAVKIAQVLLEQECKLILIACNSASAAAYELIKEFVASKAVVMDVIEPVVQYLGNTFSKKQVGLIATRATVNSSVYQNKIAALNRDITLHSHATNLLASMIEEFGDHAVVDALLDVYLTQPTLRQIDALVLACTHYPIVKQRISKRYQHEIQIVDPSDIVAEAVHRRLKENNLLNEDNKNSTRHFYVSDYTHSFASHAKLFFGEEIKLEHYPLWD